MTEPLQPGTYKLNTVVYSPEPIERSDDWRHKKYWEQGTQFRCYMVYIGMGLSLPSLYTGPHPGLAVNEERGAEIYKALLPHLERT